MSERGVFAVDRGIWDHPCFAKEPFTEREAWQWLIGEASFKERKKRVGNTVFDLERGQLVASIRFMAEAWQWHRNKVYRFLGRLKTETMIEQKSGHDATVITICNYDKYQRVSLPNVTPIETPNGTPTGHQRDKLEDNKYIEKNAADAANAEVELFRRGREVLGKDAGGLIARLLSAKQKNIALARAAIEQASTKSNPREYIGAVIRGPRRENEPQWIDGIEGVL